MEALDLVSDSCPARRRRAAVGETLSIPIDIALERPDACERPQDRADLLGFELASVRQQDELRCWNALAANRVRQREERLTRRWNCRELGKNVALRDFDCSAYLLFLVGLQQLSPPDMSQVHAGQVELFLWESSLWRFFDFFGLQGLAFSVFERLIIERFRLFFFEEPLSRLDKESLHFAVAVDPELGRTRGHARANRAHGHCARVHASQRAIRQLDALVISPVCQRFVWPSVERLLLLSRCKDVAERRQIVAITEKAQQVKSVTPEELKAKIEGKEPLTIVEALAPEKFRNAHPQAL